MPTNIINCRTPPVECRSTQIGAASRATTCSTSRCYQRQRQSSTTLTTQRHKRAAPSRRQCFISTTRSPAFRQAVRRSLSSHRNRQNPGKPQPHRQISHDKSSTISTSSRTIITITTRRAKRLRATRKASFLATTAAIRRRRSRSARTLTAALRCSISRRAA